MYYYFWKAEPVDAARIADQCNCPGITDYAIIVYPAVHVMNLKRVNLRLEGMTHRIAGIDLVQHDY